MALSREGQRTRASATRAAANASPNRPRTILCGSSGSLGHRPASEAPMNRPASPSTSQARGHSCSNSSAHLPRRTLRSKARSMAEAVTRSPAGGICRAAMVPLCMRRPCAPDTLTVLFARGC